MSDSDKVFFTHCEICGKKLIGRLPNGIWHFVFGKRKGKDGSLSKHSPVEMMIHGSVKMRCIDRTCGHWNTMNYFPDNQPSLQSTDTVESNQQPAE